MLSAGRSRAIEDVSGGAWLSELVAVLGFEPRKSSALALGAAQTFCSSHPSATRAHGGNEKARVANQRASKIQGELCHQHLPQSLQAMARLWLRASGRTSRRERISILCGPLPQSYTASGWVQAFLDRLARAVHTVIHEVRQPAPRLPVRNP